MWLVLRIGFPDPSRPSPAVHADDPAKDRDRSGRLAEIPIAPVHPGMSIAQLLTIDAYNLPRQAIVSIEERWIKSVSWMYNGGQRPPASRENLEDVRALRDNSDGRYARRGA